MSKLDVFKRTLQSSPEPIDFIRSVYGHALTALDWQQWTQTNVPVRFAGGYDPRLRLSEPNLVDVEGAKYALADKHGRTARATKNTRHALLTAVKHLIDNANTDESVVVEGSLRPIVVWKLIEGAPRPVPRVYWPGITRAEAEAIELAGLLEPTNKRAMVLLRVRVKKSTKDRIDRAAEVERKVYGEGSRMRYISAFCLSAILARVEEVEAVQEKLKVADFTGAPPAGGV